MSSFSPKLIFLTRSINRANWRVMLSLGRNPNSSSLRRPWELISPMSLEIWIFSKNFLTVSRRRKCRVFSRFELGNYAGVFSLQDRVKYFGEKGYHFPGKISLGPIFTPLGPGFLLTLSSVMTLKISIGLAKRDWLAGARENACSVFLTTRRPFLNRTMKIT